MILVYDTASLAITGNHRLHDRSSASVSTTQQYTTAGVYSHLPRAGSIGHYVSVSDGGNAPLVFQRCGPGIHICCLVWVIDDFGPSTAELRRHGYRWPTAQESAASASPPGEKGAPLFIAHILAPEAKMLLPSPIPQNNIYGYAIVAQL